MAIIRRTPALLVAMTTALVLAGCGTGPEQPNAAAIVGSTTISVNDVQQQVQSLLRNEPAAKRLAAQRKLDIVSRKVVEQLIRHELLAEAARREGLSVDEKQVAELARGVGGQQLPEDAPPDLLAEELANRSREATDVVRDQLLSVELAKSYLGRVNVEVNAVALSTMDAARKLADDIVASPEQSADLMTKAADGQPPQLNLELGANSLDALFFSVPENSVMLINANRGEQPVGYQVLHVTSRDVADKADPSVDAGQLDPAQLQQVGPFLTRLIALERGVTVNPRYGGWNNALLTLVPKSEADVADQLLVPGSPAS